jgi:hypothetical protein
MTIVIHRGAPALSRPGSQYEEHRLPGRMRRHHAAPFSSTSVRFIGVVNAGSVNRELVSVRTRTGVAGGRIGTSKSRHSSWANPARIVFEFVGAVLRPLRSLSLLHRALQPAKQALDGFTDVLHVLFVCCVHDQQRSTGAVAWRTQMRGMRNL